MYSEFFFFSSRRRHTICALVTGVQTCALPISFRDHLRSLVAAHPDHLTVHVRYSAPRPDDVAGRDFQASGRLDREALRDLLPLGDYDVYLCGPAGFMTDMRAAIEDLGLRPEGNRREAFGADRKSTRRKDSNKGETG